MRRLTDNRLVRKLRRHASITTLFRMADSGVAFDRSIAERRQLSPAHPSVETQIVQATFVNHRAVVENALDSLKPERLETYPLREAISTPRRTQTGPIERAQPTSWPQAQPSLQKQDDREWRRLQAIMRKHAEISMGENTIAGGSESNTNPPEIQEKKPQPIVATTPPAGKLKRETDEGEILQAKPEEVPKIPESGDSISSPKSVSRLGLQTPGLSGFNRLVEIETPGLVTNKDTGSKAQIFPQPIENTAPYSAGKPQSTNTSDISLNQTEDDRTSSGLDSDLILNQAARETGNKEPQFRRDAEGKGERSIPENNSTRQPPPSPPKKDNRPPVKEETSLRMDASPLEPASILTEATSSGEGQVVSNQPAPTNECLAESMGKTVVAETPSEVQKPDELKKPSIVTDGLIQQQQDSIPSQDLIHPEMENLGLPLEAVWPVSVQKNQSSKTEGARNHSTTTPPPIRHPIEDTAIQQVLSGVEIGSPAESRVELIAPRHPRPAARLLQPETEKAQKRQTGQETESNPPVIQESPLEEKPEADKEPPLQKSIQTEIGSLPSDLWQLIGQPAPIAQAEPSSREETAVHKRTENRNKNEPVDTFPEVTSRTQDHPLLQRQEETPAATPAASGENEPANNPGNNQLSPQEKAELSQRVYFEIKRRLAVEWERLRHKR